MLRIAAGLLLGVVALAGCATAGAPSAAVSSVVLEPPDGACALLGPMAVRTSSEILLSEDALLASAVQELRERAAKRGATHLVVAPTPAPAVVAYGTTGAASGVAYRCAD